MLKRALVSRTNNFDLLNDETWAMLSEEVVADFPYLSLDDLNATIKLGIKGELDKYKSAPLNFTRIYQWVKSRAPYSIGYWRTKYPELLAWADATTVTALLLPELVKIGETHSFAQVVFATVKNALVQLLQQQAYPYLATNAPAPSLEARDQEHHNFHHIETVLWPAFRAQYPDFAAKNPNLF